MSSPRGSDATGRQVRIALLGMYASANLGDVAIQLAVMRALRARRPDASFVGVCTDPVDAARTFGMPARKISGFGVLHHPGGSESVVPGWAERAPRPIQRAATWWHVRRHMGSLDMLLVSGSGQIDDFWGGPWEQPMRLLAWSHAAHRQHKPVAFFGVGVDQLLTPLGRRMALSALGLAQQRVLRDQGSLDILRSFGFDAPCDVSPDPAFHLTADSPGHPEDANGQPFAVISPIARNAWPASNGPSHEHYVQVLAECADALQGQGIAVRFACSQTRMDPPVIPQVQARMRADAAATTVLSPRTVDEYLAAVRGARVVLASRLHALILAMVAGTPVVAISYARKVSQQMKDAGLTEFDIPYAQATMDRLRPALRAACEQSAGLSAAIHTTARRNRQQLDRHFDGLAALMPGPGTAGRAA